MKRLLPLIAIEVFVWATLLLCAFLVSRVAFSINLGRTVLPSIATQIVRNGFSAGIILTWLFVWKKMTDFYLWRTLTRKGASA